MKIERIFASLGLGMRAKLIALFVVIKVIPLIFIALVAWRQAWLLGEELKKRTVDISSTAVKALTESGDIAVNDAMVALDRRATDEIERMSTDTALAVAKFLYARDDDLRFLASLEPDEAVFRRFALGKTGRLVRMGRWELAPDGKSWRREYLGSAPEQVISGIEENDHSFHYRPPERFSYETRPLYLEITFVAPDGMERVKVTTSERMSKALRDVSDRRNTYAGAETYFDELKKLGPGEIYVSDVIGEYVGTNLIGMYTPENCAKRGVPYEPEKQAFAGRENPRGRRFEGLVRWAVPVVEKGRVAGYVTMALDHDHIMEFTDHIMPTAERYTELSDAYEGNYAFIWDYKGRSIVHPRHHSITGFDPATGDPQVPWLEDRIYDAWQASGLPYAEFVKNVPTFAAQSNSKKPARQLTERGLVGLDCRYLNFAPQCTGWFDLTSRGGSGSFLILWSGLWKLNTAAAIPYYTGNYGKSPRGFGFVAVGAGLADFHRPAAVTREVIRKRVTDTDAQLQDMAASTFRAIGENLLDTARRLTVSTGLMILAVVLIAVWLASAFTGSITRMIRGISRFRSGERQFRFNAVIKDEMGALADSFDDMADAVAESVHVPMCIVDLDRNLKYANAGALALFNESEPAHVVGKPYEQFSIFPKDSPYCPITALENGTEAEVLFHAPSGRYRRGSATWLTDNEGRHMGMIITVADVTDLIEEQKRIERQRALLSSVFEASPDLMWYQDIAGRYLGVNPRFAAAFGTDARAVRGRTPQECLPASVALTIAENDSLAFESAGPVYTEERCVFADGHEEILDVVRTPLFDATGKTVGLLGVGRDVTQRVNVENRLRRTRRELRKAAAAANRASESKSAFLARMSHEIRTPMNAIIGLTNIAKRKLKDDGADKEEILHYVSRIESSSAHLLGLLNDILDISKIEAGKIELTEESFDLPRLISGVTGIISPRCREKGIAFHVDEQGLETANFIADHLRLRQVLINLLGNAVKFTPECGEIWFTVKQTGRADGMTTVHFSVRDTGIGIDPEQKERLFKPFEQLGSHITRQFGGTGLGLSISKSIVNMFGGDITVVSEEGKGSVFSFDLRLKEDATRADAAEAVVSDVTTLSGRRALLVDDVEVNRVIVIDMLSDAGMIIEEAEDGAVALEKFRQSPPGWYDVIFMDIQMPNMNGYDAATAIRALSRDDARTVPVFALTANAFKEDVDRAIASGMNGHLAKPLEADKLLETLLSWFGRGA
ncbi:MAG: response regulator [Desulfovibrio sp.]|jgi:PAS domain S-box-containing protein|nr:response regulator [Desulfovibrio sp.]